MKLPDACTNKEGKTTTPSLEAGVNAMIERVKSSSVSRRRLAAIVRKAITSYYTEQEQQEVAEAARRQQISMSSFVASAALKEARRMNLPNRHK
jgi:hypothetical protein